MSDIIEISLSFMISIPILILGIREVAILLKFKTGTYLIVKGKIIEIKLISSGRFNRYIPIIEFSDGDKTYRSQGYNFSSKHKVGDEVKIFFNPNNFPNVVYITNGIKDFNGILWIIFGGLLVPWLFIGIYLFSSDMYVRGFYINKIIYFLPLLIIVFLVTVVFSIIVLRVNLFSRYHGTYSKNTNKEKADYIKNTSYSKTFKSADSLTKEDRMKIISLIKEEKRTEAINFYIKKARVKPEVAEEVIDKYTNYI